MLLLLVVLAVSGCMQAARVFLDVNKLERPPESQGEPGGVPEGYVIVPEQPEVVPAPIEKITDPDSMLAMLPTDHSGSVDWVSALRDGVIRPRMRKGVMPDSTDSFGYDVYLSHGDGPEAFFPHSEHQQWMSCQSCHPQIYRNGAASLTPETAHDSESCAFCHGKVAFPIRACERCHEAGKDLPSNRLEKTLGATLTMVRYDTIEWGEGRRRTGVEDLDLVTAYQPARFPHGEHRLRFQCSACHEKPFRMERGASILTQEEAHGGGACGACHNGGTAFEIGIDECYRCHTGTADTGG
jgi:c(7)-type cytochrome triheme protein